MTVSIITNATNSKNFLTHYEVNRGIWVDIILSFEPQLKEIGFPTQFRKSFCNETRYKLKPAMYSSSCIFLF